MKTIKDNVKVNKAHKTIPQFENPLDNIISSMFHGFEGTMAQEKEIESYIDSNISNFLKSPRVNSDIDLKMLVDNFKSSSIPDFPMDISKYMDFVNDNIVKHSVNTASPRFIGHMTTSLPYFTRPFAKLIAAINQNVVKIETSKAVSPCERQVLAMLHRLVYNYSDEFYNEHIQNSKSTLGIITSGGTIANITALWCARNSCLSSGYGFKGVEIEGMQAALDFHGYKDLVVIGPSSMHYSFDKAVGLLGIGEKNLLKIQVNSQNHMDLNVLQETIEECRKARKGIITIIGVAGTTESGSIDPLWDIGKIAAQENIHFHVDAAWGGPLLFSQKYCSKLRGIDLADTVTIDGHKQLYLPMGNGMLLLRYPQKAKNIEKQAYYIAREKSMDLGKRSLEGSRPATALYIHAALNIIGCKGFEFLLEEGIRKIRYAVDTITQREEFEVLAEPEMNILIYRYIPRSLRARVAQGLITKDENEHINKFNELLQKNQRQKGTTFISRTKTRSTQYGKDMLLVALRMVISNPLTTEKDIDAVLDDQINIARYINV